MTETYDRDFKGIWIPKEIWLSDELSTNEKVILMEIDSLDGGPGCCVSNQRLAEFCKCSESMVDKAIKHLKELEYISIVSAGRQRIIRSMVVNFTLQSRKNYALDRKFYAGDRKFYADDRKNYAQDNLIDNNNIYNNIYNNKNINNNINNNISSLRSDISESNTEKQSEKSSDSQVIDEIYEAYNSICKSLTKCRMRSEARNSAIRARVKQSGKDNVIEAFRLAEQSDFLTGRISVGDKPFVANIDWILKQSNFIKILEGNYKNRPSRKAGNGTMYMGSNDGFDLVTDFDIPEERKK